MIEVCNWICAVSSQIVSHANNSEQHKVSHASFIVDLQHYCGQMIPLCTVVVHSCKDETC